MAETIFSDADEVKSVAMELIDREEEFEHLRDQPFVYLFTDKPIKKGDSVQYGKVEIVSGANAHLYWTAKGNKTVKPLFRITLCDSLWKALSPDQRVWVLKHQLRHCKVKKGKNGTKLRLASHDAEVFLADLADASVPLVCAIWKVIAETEAAGMQPPLPMDDDEDQAVPLPISSGRP